MAELEELQREIVALVAAVQIDRAEALALQMDPAARADIRQPGVHSQLEGLLARLDAISKPHEAGGTPLAQDPVSQPGWFLQIIGDDMAPDLKRGDFVEIDRRRPSPDGLYAVSEDDGRVMVRRVQVVPGSRPLRVVIGNDLNAPDVRELVADDLKICGRVVG